MKIGITKNSLSDEKFSQYESWLLRFNPAIEFHVLTCEENQPDEVDTCDGVLLTGGADIHPASYRKPEAVSQTEDADEQRDAFEFRVIEKSLKRPIPLLGICRGLQSVNVFLGGTLHLDLETDGFSRHEETGGHEHRHGIVIEDHSMLKTLVGKTSGEVNSSHHQAADVLGKGLEAGATSDDGVVESLEWKDRNRKPFLLLVQWHPERMKDTFNPLSEKIGRVFLEEIAKHKNNN